MDDGDGGKNRKAQPNRFPKTFWKVEEFHQKLAGLGGPFFFGHIRVFSASYASCSHGDGDAQDNAYGFSSAAEAAWKRVTIHKAKSTPTLRCDFLFQ